MKNKFLLFFLLMLQTATSFSANPDLEISDRELQEYCSEICNAISDYRVSKLDTFLRPDFSLQVAASKSSNRAEKRVKKDDCLVVLCAIPQFKIPVTKGIACTNFAINGSKAEVFGYLQAHADDNPSRVLIFSRRFKAELEKENGRIFIRRIECSGVDGYYPRVSESILWNCLVKYLYFFFHLFGNND